ncbi:hypothetical protein B0H13DRAFT_2337610 [Mycena leptocephala]|nr:hypothetical protein B0H13DRAFT_2337610 [Mycena leptocephala]
MNLKYYNHFQLADVVHEKNEEMNLQKLKGLKLRDKYQIAMSHLSDHEIFLSTVAMDDMSSVGRLVAICLKQKRAISEITNRMSLSIRGMYHVKSFTENNMDIQRLVLSFGGPKLCYALAKALNLPSVRTVQSKSNFPTIRPCVGFPLRKEIEANLDSVHDTQVFWEKGKPLPCRGFSLLIDEIALEQRPKYDTDHDCIVGFSRFEAASCDMYHPTEETLGAMVDAIREGTLTRATEATVAAWAKQKILDPSGVHHIGLNGGDRLEGLYGICRLMDNSRNVDILQLSQRASTTAESCRIFAKHPDWDRGHKRLRLEGAEGVDHTNPRSHTGDVSIANVSLLTSWNCGRRQAIELMKLLKIPVEDITLLLRSDTVDLLCPHGSYVGLREGDIDFTMSWMDDISDVVDPQPSEAAQDTVDRDENGLEELEELLPAPGNNDLDSVRKKDRAWLTLKDAGGKPKHYHKASAVRYLLCTEDGLKSTDRLVRVQGLAKIRCYSRNPATPSLADDSVVGDVFLLNQLVATFIRVKNDVALAVLRVTAIENEKKTLLSSIAKSELSSDKVTLRGQVLVLSFDVNRDPKLKTPATQKSHWVWQPNQFESFNVADGQVTKKSSIIEVPATLTQCVKGTLVPHPAGRCTWQFDVDTLLALSDFLWQDVKANVKSLPSCKATATLPCRDDKGEYLFINSEGSAAVQSGPKDGHDACHLCLAEVELKKMRDHVARHLAANRIGVKENLKHPLTDNPCGFCGRSGTYNLDLSKTTRSYIPESNCPYFRKFSLASAEKTTTSGPSTNRPLRCEICHGSQPERTQIRRHEHVFWSYNLPAHIESSHPDTDISADFAASFAVTDEELINLKLKTKADKQGGKRKAADGGEAPASQRRRTV